MKKGFTLIELLVVILIIGILAAVAVPQYQKAVDKAHLVPYLNFASKVRDAQNIYYLSNNKYADNLDNLDINFNISDLCSSKQSRTDVWFAWNCKYGFGLDNYDGGRGKFFRIFFCPDEANNVNENYNPCWNNRSAFIDFYYDTHETRAGKIVCVSFSPRGSHICSQFN